MVVLALALAGCGDDDGPSAAEARSDQIREAVAGAGLADDVVDVLALAAAGTDATYRVAYELATTDGDVQRVELTQRPPDRRLEVTNADGTAVATIAVDGTFHQCQLDETWSCSEVGETEAGGGVTLDPDAVTRLASSLAHGADRYDLSVEHRDLVGVDATCLLAQLRADVDATDDEGAAGTLCVSPEGALLLTERAQERLEAVDYTAEVDDDAFALPA